MRTIGTLVVLFIIAGIIIPFAVGARYSQESTERADCVCDSVDSTTIPCVSFEGEGHIFITYLVNVRIERSGTRIPSCPDQLRTETNHTFSFMEWPVDNRSIEINF